MPVCAPWVQRPLTKTLKYCADAIGQGILTKIGYPEYPFRGIHRMHGLYVELGCSSKPNRREKCMVFCNFRIHLNFGLKGGIMNVYLLNVW